MIDKEKIDRLANRHCARTLTNLEDAECPRLYINAVRDGFRWLRSDLRDECDVEGDRGNS